MFPGFEYLSRLIWRMYRNADSVDSASVCRAVKFEGTCRYFNLFLLPSLLGLGLVAAPKVWAGGRYPHMTLPSSPAQPSPAQPSPAQPSPAQPVVTRTGWPQERTWCWAGPWSPRPDTDTHGYHLLEVFAVLTPELLPMSKNKCCLHLVFSHRALSSDQAGPALMQICPECSAGEARCAVPRSSM